MWVDKQILILGWLDKLSRIYFDRRDYMKRNSFVNFTLFCEFFSRFFRGFLLFLNIIWNYNFGWNVVWVKCGLGETWFGWNVVWVKCYWVKCYRVKCYRVKCYWVKCSRSLSFSVSLTLSLSSFFHLWYTSSVQKNVKGGRKVNVLM